MSLHVLDEQRYFNLILTEKFPIFRGQICDRKQGAFFLLMLNFHFHTSGSTILDKERCEVSMQTDNSFRRYEAKNALQ